MTKPAALCPLCGQSYDQPHQLTVCGDCHASLSAEVALRNTAEFSVDQLLADTVRQGAPPAPAIAAQSPIRCTWCGRSPEQVRKVLSHGDAHICDECVALCHDIMTAELGE